MSGYSYLASDITGADWRIQARWNQFSALSAVARSHNSKPWSGNIEVDDFVGKIKIEGRDSINKNFQPEKEQTETA
ncbi:glycoside hydrolase family 31 protein, partial [Salmonella enterica subsp. enterica serovar Typhimurium]|nr:glycoside hydrolase family 31 protein [Salmonella enterica subsp. enterica serovar Typhimurium]